MTEQLDALMRLKGKIDKRWQELSVNRNYFQEEMETCELQMGEVRALLSLVENEIATLTEVKE